MILSYLKKIVTFSLKIALASLIVVGMVSATSIVFLGVLVGVITAVGGYSQESDITREVIYGKSESENQFVSIPIHGMIVGDGSDVGAPLGLLNEMLTYGYDVKKNLRELADDRSVSGIILDINSPGGTIYGSKAIADGVAYYKEKTGKPVVSFVSGLAASGAYWSAIASDMVIADTGTSVGSIGVITGPFQYYDTVLAQDGGIFSGGIVTQNGIETNYISAGKFKDFGNPYRKLTQEEIDAMQRMVNNEYDTFTAYVSSRRNIPQDMVISDIGALLYDGKTALEKKLIDKTGTREDAYAELALQANIPDDNFSVSEEYPKKGLLLSILEATSGMKPVRATVSLCGLTNVHLVFHGDVATLCQ